MLTPSHVVCFFELWQEQQRREEEEQQRLEEEKNRLKAERETAKRAKAEQFKKKVFSVVTG